MELIPDIIDFRKRSHTFTSPFYPRQSAVTRQHEHINVHLLFNIEDAESITPSNLQPLTFYTNDDSSSKCSYISPHRLQIFWNSIHLEFLEGEINFAIYFYLTSAASNLYATMLPCFARLPNY